MDIKLEHVNTSGTISRIPSAERHRGLWPNMQDSIDQNRIMLNDKLENRPKFNFSMNKIAKRDDPRSLKMDGTFFNNTTMQPFVPNVVSMNKMNQSQ